MNQLLKKYEPKVVQRLKAECEKAKINLSSSNETSIQVNNLIEGLDNIDLNASLQITREQIEELNQNLFNQYINISKKNNCRISTVKYFRY